MTERSKETKAVDVAALVDKNIAFEVRTAESPDERASGSGEKRRKPSIPSARKRPRMHTSVRLP